MENPIVPEVIENNNVDILEKFEREKHLHKNLDAYREHLQELKREKEERENINKMAIQRNKRYSYLCEGLLIITSPIWVPLYGAYYLYHSIVNPGRYAFDL
jgi:hypothetical protein